MIQSLSETQKNDFNSLKEDARRLSEEPLVSVIMPAFNAAPYISQAINSVLRQTYQNLELIIINDHSADNTEAIISGYMEDPRIRYEKPPGALRKPSSVRNHGSRLAQGELLFFFDADDLLDKNALRNLVNYLQQNPQSEMVYGFMTHIDPEGNPIPSAGFKLVPQPDGSHCIPEGYSHTWDRVASFKFVASLNFMIRKTAFEAVNGFDETLAAAEDIQLYLKLFMQSLNAVGVVPHYLIQYRQHPKSLTKNIEQIEKLLQAHLQVVDWAFSQEKFPASHRHYQAFTACKAYNYVAGVRLAQGDQSSAFRLLLRALGDRRTTLQQWLQVCPSTLLRCLLPTWADSHLKSIAVELRDGVLLGKLKAVLSS